jgi:serine/threonine protein kinase
VAIKFENKQGKSAPQLEHEVEVLNALRNGIPNLQGVAECLYYGVEGTHNCMVMELLGKSLEDRMVECKNKLNVRTTVLIAEQVIQRIEYLHSKGMVHRDIKPENFMFGIKDKIHHIYIIDFGLSKKYWDEARNTHCQHRQKLSLTGTARYASINAHKGVEQSRRDDLEAIGHMFLYFLRGALPWSGLDAKTQEEKYRKICQKKEETKLEDLCKGFPDEFMHYLKYARGLDFEERPDYDKLYSQIHSARPKGETIKDHNYQWFDNKEPEGQLTPLNPRQSCPQPDDNKSNKKGGTACFSCAIQ